MSERRLRAKWDSYLEMVMPPAAGAVQVEETRRAFYAGASAMFDVMMNMLDPGAEPTDADLAKVSEVEKELKDHVKDMLRQAKERAP